MQQTGSDWEPFILRTEQQWARRLGDHAGLRGVGQGQGRAVGPTQDLSGNSVYLSVGKMVVTVVMVAMVMVVVVAMPMVVVVMVAVVIVMTVMMPMMVIMAVTVVAVLFSAW